MIVQKTINVKIVHYSSQQELEVEWIELEAPNGSFVILPEHCQIVSLLRQNSALSFKNKSGTIGSIAIIGGVALFDGISDLTILIWA